jgi:hypothetical protein
LRSVASQLAPWAQIISTTVALSASRILIVGFKANFSHQLCREEIRGLAGQISSPFPIPKRRKLTLKNGHQYCSHPVILACVGGKKGKRGAVGSWVRDLKVGQFTLSMGPARAEVGSYIKRATIPSKRLVYTLKYLQNATQAIIDNTCLV